MLGTKYAFSYSLFCMSSKLFKCSLKLVIGKGEKFERSANQGPIIGGPFSLMDTEGRVVTEKNLLGNWVLLYFGYTSSPDVGPAEVRKMANTINILGFTLLLCLILYRMFLNALLLKCLNLTGKRVEAEHKGLTRICYN